MKNIVIAAGYATRLGELTRNFPKPLLQIGESTILGRMLDDIDRIPEIDEHIVITDPEGKTLYCPPVFGVQDGKLYMFYGGSYNCTPQQIGCAVSDDGCFFRKIFSR